MRKGIDIIKQVKEKLGKSADAGDYIDDFKKSDAPQFKGKSDKKKEKMAVAAYLDSKEEVEIKEMDLLITTKDDRTSVEVQKFLQSLASGKYKSELRGVEVIEPKKILQMFDTSANVVPFKVKKELEKKFRNNIKVVMEEVKEEKRQLKDPKKEAMVMKVKDSGSIMVIDKKDLEKYLSKGYIQVESNDVELNIESLEKDDEKSVKKVIKGLKKAVDAHSGQVKSLTKDIKDEVESNLQEKEMTYTVVHVKKGKEVIKAKSSYDAAKKFAKMKGLSSTAGVDAHLMEGNITEQTVFVVRFEKEGLRFATPFHDMKRAKEGEIILKKTPGVSYIKITKDVLKPGIFLNNPVKEGIIVKEENLEVVEVQEVVDNSIMARTTRLISQTAIKEKLDPADVDVRATDLDRKAADKNIFIQLKRAQDMKGRADVEFLDKKKQKVDIRVINKALDMFDKLKPADKAKMQTAMGKSYRDLLKVVQRGKV